MSTIIDAVWFWSVRALMGTWHGVWTQTTDGVTTGGVASETPVDGSWLEGGYVDGNYVLVSVLVGIIMVAAMVHLIRRLTPPHRPPPKR